MKCFYSRDPFMLIRAYKSFIRQSLEYGSPVWSPCGIGDIHAIENIQRSFMCKVLHVCLKPYMTYVNRLKYLCLNG